MSRNPDPPAATDAATREYRRSVWRVLWEDVFRAWVRPDDVVLDLGAGGCEFINAVVARRRIAIDLDGAMRTAADAGVEAHVQSIGDLRFLADGEIDVVFSSNCLEHLMTKDSVAHVLGEARRVLKPGGTLILMGPNIRYVGGEYWDFFDHHLALTERSLCTQLGRLGFDIIECRPRFLPYRFRENTPRWPWLVRAYLRTLPLSARLFGKQFLIVARPR